MAAGTATSTGTIDGTNIIQTSDGSGSALQVRIRDSLGNTYYINAPATDGASWIPGGTVTLTAVAAPPAP
jgi:hypothetical protein